MIDALIISCALGFGSGVALDGNTFITANHVVEGDTCTVNGREFTMVQVDRDRDIFVGRVTRPFDKPAPIVSCNPLVTGDRYTIRGARRTTTVTVINTRYDVRVATGITRDLRGVTGRAYPGQSGAPVLDSEGRVAGLLSASTADGNAGVIEFASTGLCGQ